MPLRLLLLAFTLLLAGAVGAEGIPTRPLIIGSEQDYPPLATGRSDATAGGFTVELWKEVAQETGLNYVIRVKPFHELLQEFKEGTIDVLINLAQSPERRKYADFSVPHATVHAAIFMRKGQPGIRSEKDLAGKAIIVVAADIAHEYALDKGWGKQLTLVATAADGLHLLAAGRHEAMVVSKLVGLHTLRQLGMPSIIMLPITDGASQKFAFAVRKGNAELLALLNEGLAASRANGSYAAIHAKWFDPYEFKPPPLHDLLKYLVPLLVLFLGYVALTYYRRHNERKQAMQQLAESHHKLQTGLLGAYEDLNEARRIQEEMLLASIVYENSSESMMVTDAAGDIIAINPAFTRTTGYSRKEVIGRNARILNSGHHDQAFFKKMWEELNTSGCWQGEIWDRRKNGEMYPKWLTINSAFDAEGRPFRRVALFSDITEQKKSEKLIWQQANFDTLTGLPNRRMFHDRLKQEIKKSHRGNRHLALLFIDLDRFKEVNDSLGHDKGDQLLNEAAQRLSNCVRETDTVARLGGDEFIIILAELEDTRGIDRIAQTILKSLASSFSLGGEMAYVSASIGITIYPEDALHADNLIKNADQAMYEAKSQGRNRYSYFIPSMDLAARTKASLIGDLRVALAEKQFWLAYQPIVSLTTGESHLAEALLRWQHPSQGLLYPAEFIPIAEETGIIIDLGNWVFQEASRQVTLWRATHDASFQVSINKSAVQFLNDKAVTKGWLELLQEMDIPRCSLVVEITENVLLHATTIVEDKLIRFHKESMAVCIDDFGTGYSSLSHLRKLDIDYLKIDQCFIANMATSAEDLALCEAIILMAHKLKIKVIAEGVETAAQRDLLLAAGCDYAQGYFFSRPVAPAAFESFQAWQREP
jgi:diguanylate cyclase (GGDEF)-like protein/PAS domain S-box-containing protein